MLRFSEYLLEDLVRKQVTDNPKGGLHGLIWQDHYKKSQGRNATEKILTANESAAKEFNKAHIRVMRHTNLDEKTARDFLDSDYGTKLYGNHTSPGRIKSLVRSYRWTIPPKPKDKK